MDARFWSSGSATHRVVSGLANTMSSTNRRRISVPSAAAGQLLLAYEDVGTGRVWIANSDFGGVFGVVDDDVRLDHSDRSAVELDDVVIGRLAPFEGRGVMRHDVVVVAVIAIPALDVRTLQPRVEEREVLERHRARSSHPMSSVEDGVTRRCIQAVGGVERSSHISGPRE